MAGKNSALAAEPLSSVETVRQELRQLGYLDSGFDRFVLKGAGTRSSILRASLTAALRVGLLGGVLAASAVLLTAVGVDPRLAQQPWDFAVLSAYLVCLLGGAIAALALAAGLAAAWFGRHLRHDPGPRLARNVGLALGVATLVYFVFWWRSHVLASHALLQTLGLAIALGLSLALGRFGTLAAVAVLTTAGPRRHLPRASLTRHHMLRLLASAALALAAGLAAVSFVTQPSYPTVDFAVVPTGLRVRVLGIDGLEARMARQMMARDLMPHLASLLSSGAWGELRVEPERVPAIVWTTVATGQGSEAHGIRSAGARRLAGMQTALGASLSGVLGSATDLLRITRTQPPTSVWRSAKSFWKVASDKDLRVGVVNWWASWPADAVNGFLVSDRAFFKLDQGGPFDREVHPPEVFKRLQKLPLHTYGERARALDRFHLDAARLLRAERRLDLEVVYLPGLDIFTQQQMTSAAVADLARLDTRLDAVRDYYRFVDGLVGEAVEGPGVDVFILVADPGRLARLAPGETRGLLALAGGPVVPGVKLGTVSERDVAPTVLHLLGLPLSRELDGVVRDEALEPTFRDRHPVRHVATYGRRRAAGSAESTFDPQVVEELRSLGYIE